MVFLAPLIGCKRQIRPNVGMDMILPPGAETMQVPKDKVFLMAAPISEKMPDFPAGLLTRSARDTHICVEIVVSEEGSVSSVIPLYETIECPLSKKHTDERFTKAVTNAVQTWEFFAAAICTFPATIAKNDDCKGEGVVTDRVAIKMSFVFSFQVDRGRVSLRRRRT